MTVQCSACYRVYEGRRECPYCGFVPVAQSGRTIEEEAGELVRINKSLVNAEAAKAEAEKKKKEVWGATTRAELERIAAERGYKPGWVTHTINLRKRYGRPVVDSAQAVA